MALFWIASGAGPPQPKVKATLTGPRGTAYDPHGPRDRSGYTPDAAMRAPTLAKAAAAVGRAGKAHSGLLVATDASKTTTLICSTNLRLAKMFGKADVARDALLVATDLVNPIHFSKDLLLNQGPPQQLVGKSVCLRKFLGPASSVSSIFARPRA